MESFKNSAVELKWTRTSSREVTEDGGGSGGNRDNKERRVGKKKKHLRAGRLQGKEFGEINN